MEIWTSVASVVAALGAVVLAAYLASRQSIATRAREVADELEDRVARLEASALVSRQRYGDQLTDLFRRVERIERAMNFGWQPGRRRGRDDE